jgi:hypothetical protein
MQEPDAQQAIENLARELAGVSHIEVDPKGWTKFGRRLDGAAG